MEDISKKAVEILLILFLIIFLIQTSFTIQDLTGRATSGTAEITLEITAGNPVLSSILPNQEFVNTLTPTISCVTDINSNCRYSNNATNYTNMTDFSQSQGGTVHNHTLEQLSNQRYTFYIVCNSTQNKHSTLYNTTFNVSYTNVTNENITVNETTFTVTNTSYQSRKVEYNNTQNSSISTPIYIEIPNTNETITTTLTVAPSKKRDIVSLENHMIISPKTATVNNVTFNNVTNTLKATLSETDLTYVNDTQDTFIATNTTSTFSLDIAVKQGYNRQLASIEDTLFVFSPETAIIEKMLHNTTSSRIESEITDTLLSDQRQEIVLNLDSTTTARFNATVKNGSNKTYTDCNNLVALPLDKFVVTTGDACVDYSNYSATSTLQRLNVSANGTTQEEVTIWVNDKSIPSNVYIDNVLQPSTNWSYDSSSHTVYVNISFGSVHNVRVEWVITPTTEEETTTTTAGGGGGGGGIVSEVKSSFKTNLDLIKIQIQQGETFTRTLKITNDGEKSLDFALTTNKPTKLLTINPSSFALRVGESKDVKLKFKIPTNYPLGVYPNKLLIQTNKPSKEIPIVIEVESLNIMFDVSLDIPAQYKEIDPGKTIKIDMILFNMKRIGLSNVTINYIIKSLTGEIIFHEKEEVEVNEQASFSKFINIPENTKPGDYVFIVQTQYADSIGTTSELFLIKEPLLGIPPGKRIEQAIKTTTTTLTPIILLSVIIILSLVLYEYRKFHGLRKLHAKKLSKIRHNIKRKATSKQKLKEQKTILTKKLKSLEEGFKKGYISNSSYLKGKRKIKAKLQKLHK